MVKITACQYQMERMSDWKTYSAKMEELVSHAKKIGTDILLLPEYSGTEAACGKFTTEKELFSVLENRLPEYIELFQTLAHRHHIYIQAGTIIEKTSSGKYANRAYFFSPDKSFGYQDKLQFTEFEKDLQLLQPGDKQQIFETPLGNIGIAVCYDSEFPEIVRQLIANDAKIILVPSYTTSVAGYNRVFLSCRARAIENQCFVAASFVVSRVDLSAEAENTFGQAAIFGPADVGFPDDGIIAQGKLNEVMLVSADVKLQKLDSVRRHGQVHNYQDSMKLLSN